MREQPLHFLAVCTEWLPRNGGLPQFNRRLCEALARAGDRVTCAVHDAVDDDFDDAIARGVALVVPRLHRGHHRDLRAACDDEDSVSAVIGHDRHTGPAAAFHAAYHAQGATLVHIVHTTPDEIEPFKHREGWTARAELRFEELRQLCASADVVCAVGPRLHRKVGSALDGGYGGIDVIRLDPGLDDGWTSETRIPGPEPICLFLGRADDSALKGLDIAARTVAALERNVAPTPILWIRGANPECADALHAQVVEGGGPYPSNIVVRQYAPGSGAVREDLLRSSVLMMPSRAEGFGLVGLEAIAAGTPVLLSRRSGLAELLTEIAGEEAEPFIVDVQGDESDHERWRDRLGSLLHNRDAAFARTHELRQRVAGAVSWDVAAQELRNAITRHHTTNREVGES